MLTTKQQSRIDKKCASVVAVAIDAFPSLLARATPEAAAEIVADLIKTHLTRPLPQTDPGEALARIVQLASNCEGAV